MNQHMRSEPIPFIDIAAQRRRLGSAIDVATKRVLDHCQFISGPEVTQLETMLAAYCGAKHVITCANGTDALVMVLKIPLEKMRVHNFVLHTLYEVM